MVYFIFCSACSGRQRVRHRTDTLLPYTTLFRAFPAVLVLYGGGWEHGDRKQLSSIAKDLARRGYVAVASTYRLAPEYIFPAQLRDVQLAVRWMRAQSADYHIDGTRIGVWGYSAGAHLAALLGGKIGRTHV